MAGPFDFFTPGEDPLAAIQPYFANPAIQGAMLQFGLNAMAPPSWGDTGMTQFGRALGGAGEYVGRREEMDRREQESDAKTQALEARAQAAQARAGSAAQGVTNAQQKFEIAKLLEQGRMDRSKTNIRVRAALAYGKQLQDIDKDILASPEDKASRKQQLKERFQPFLSGDQDIEGGFGDEMSTVNTPTGVVEAPRDPTQRKPNTTYQTPRGPMTWTGTGWLPLR